MASGRVLSAVLLLAIATVTVSALIGEHGVPHLLRLRADCYAVNDDARLRNAVRDLGDFLSAEPQPIVVPQAR